jgi:hypothetical protein
MAARRLHRWRGMFSAAAGFLFAAMLQINRRED